MTTQTRKYRGKYPNNIRQIESIAKGKILLTTNNGCWYIVNAHDTNGKSPNLNQDVFEWPVTVFTPPLKTNQQRDDEWYSR